MVDRLSAFAANGTAYRTLGEKAYGTLHEAIVAGALRPGERLPIEDLAAATRMSPMPIREALRRLESVGLVELIPHRGARVAEISVEDLKEIYDWRLRLEVPAIGQAAGEFTEADATLAGDWLTRLGAAVEEGDDAAASEAHMRLHFTLYRAESSRLLHRLVSPLWDSAERYLVATRAARPLLKSRVDEHQEMLDACRGQEAERAESLLSAYLVRMANAISIEMTGSDLYAGRATAARST